MHSADRRATARQYEPLLPEFFPIRLIDDFIAVDFVVGCSFDCRFCTSRRHPARLALFDSGVALENRVPPLKMASWLRSMPSYRAGVEVRIGCDTDAGLEFEKSAALIDLADRDRPLVYQTRKPLSERERAFFGGDRPNLVLELTATPRSDALAAASDPLDLVRSAASLDPRMLRWIVGPLAADGVPGALQVIEALPPGSRLLLQPLDPAGLPRFDRPAPMPASDLARLEALARGRGLAVGERPGGTPSPAEVDLPALRRRLGEELSFLGLTLTQEPIRTGPRAFAVRVAEPCARGEEAYLNRVLGQGVSVALSTRERGRSQGGSFSGIDPAVLRRWYLNGFFPVTEMNLVAENTLADLRRLLDSRECVPGARPRGARPIASGAASQAGAPR